MSAPPDSPPRGDERVVDADPGVCPPLPRWDLRRGEVEEVGRGSPPEPRMPRASWLSSPAAQGLSPADSWRSRAKRREWPQMRAFATERTGTDLSSGQ